MEEKEDGKAWMRRRYQKDARRLRLGEVERMVVGRSDRDTVADRWREAPPLLPAKPPTSDDNQSK